MGARNKLNAAYANGALIIAAILGLLLQSWPVFIVVAIWLLIESLSTGDIRPKGRK